MIQEIINHFALSLEEEIQRHHKLIEILKEKILKNMSNSIKDLKSKATSISNLSKKKNEVEKITKELEESVLKYYKSCQTFEENYKERKIKKDIKPYFDDDDDKNKEISEDKARLYLRHKSVGEKQNVYQNYITVYNHKCSKIIVEIVNFFYIF